MADKLVLIEASGSPQVAVSIHGSDHALSQRDQLVQEIEALKISIALQHESCDVARDILARREASYAVARVNASARHEVLTSEHHAMHEADIREGHERLTAIMAALGDMNRELRELEARLDFLDRQSSR